MKAYRRWFPLILSLVLAIDVSGRAASEHHGYVRYRELPMPGVVVVATNGDTLLRTITDAQGAYSFSDLKEATWTIHLEMSGFAPIHCDLTVVPGAEPTVWDLKMVSLSDMQPQFSSGFVSLPPAAALERSGAPFLEVTPPSPAPRPDTGTSNANHHRTHEALLINGSVNDGESPAFGNNRSVGPPLYTANLSLTADNSALDARPFSLTGQDTQKANYNRSEASITVDGPLPIRFPLRDGPRLTVIYSRAQNRNVSLQTARVPTMSERIGDFSNNAKVIVDPATSAPFPGNVILQERISPQAVALLTLYPLPNFTPEAHYNYQKLMAGVTHRDDLQVQTGASVDGQQFSGSFGLQSTRTDNPNLFGFVDAIRNQAINATLSWSRRLTPRLSANASYAFRRTVARTIPYFAYRENVSGNAGIGSNSQDPRNWGPPNLNFSGGIAGLFDGQHGFDRTQSNAISYAGSWNRGHHAVSFGVSFLDQQFNLFSEQDARGTLTFTGAASGIDFADFLLGIPTASSIAFGNPDRYFSQHVYDAFVMEDWRAGSSLTLNLGVRWEYEAPVTERYARLVNLDISPGFANVAPVLANAPRGSLTGQIYPTSLVRPDRGGVQPRVGLAWRPWADSTLLVRAGYGIYRDAAVYRSIANELSQQFPFSTHLSVENSRPPSLTLANGFIESPLNTPNTFAVNPGFRIGYAQNWQLSLQRDLPAALQVTATYLGIKGTHLQQRSMPNTFPSGAPLLCGTCPAGYVYLTSNGNSNQHAATVQIRRRQLNGFATSLEYTFSKSIDDSGLGSFHVAQDWRNPRAERAVSNFDQRHRMTVQAQYTTGMLAGIGAWSDGWTGTLLREWTLMTDWRVSSGSPLTPVLIAPVQGTGLTGSLRPDYTGAPLNAGSGEMLLNASAFSLPGPGKWGNAGRNLIRAPGQFFLDASIARTFRLDQGIGIDLRVDITNVLNHVTFASWNTAVNNSLFGLPTGANSMRTIRPSLQVRF